MASSPFSRASSPSPSPSPDHHLPLRVPRLVQIRQSQLLSLFLDDWQRLFDASQRSLERKLSNSSSSRSDLYQIFGLFFVFQGVVLTAVAQGNTLTCHNWVPVFALSAIASVAAIGATLQKLNEHAEYREQYRIEKAVFRSLGKCIDELKERGEAYDLEEQQPVLPDSYRNPDSTGQTFCDRLLSDIQSFFLIHVFSYAGAVIALLLAFSGLVLFCIHQILCNPGCPVNGCTSSPSPST